MIELFPFVTLFAICVELSFLYAVYIKLSARILHAALSWKHSLVFAFAVIVLTVVARAAAAAGGQSVPLIVLLPFEFAVSLALGGWLFDSRGFTLQGHPLGWRGALQVSALAFVILALTERVL